MSFAEIRFPTDISYGSAGGPEFSTDVVVTHSGYEQRNSNWQQARLRYNVAYGVKTESQLQELIAFFRARKGQAEGFRFKDWSDYKAIAQTIGSGDGVTVDFQLVKHYVSGDSTSSRTIYKPVSGSESIYINSTLQTTGYSLDSSTGIVSFDVPPNVGDTIVADFEFDVPVRFATDRISARLDDYGIFSILDIALIEVRI